MDLSKKIANEDEYREALKEYDLIFSLDGCCNIPNYGDLLFDRIKEWEINIVDQKKLDET